MYRFNVSSPERRTHDIFSKEFPKPNLPRFHTLQFKISCTLKITYQGMPYLTKPPSCRPNEQRRPDSCKINPKEETSHQSPMGTAQKATVVLATEKRFSLPANASGNQDATNGMELEIICCSLITSPSMNYVI